jgi:hypothetical protein
MFTRCKNDSSVINSIYFGQLQFSHKQYFFSMSVAPIDKMGESSNIKNHLIV